MKKFIAIVFLCSLAGAVHSETLFDFFRDGLNGKDPKSTEIESFLASGEKTISGGIISFKINMNTVNYTVSFDDSKMSASGVESLVASFKNTEYFIFDDNQSRTGVIRSMLEIELHGIGCYYSSGVQKQDTNIGTWRNKYWTFVITDDGKNIELKIRKIREEISLVRQFEGSNNK